MTAITVNDLKKDYLLYDSPLDLLKTYISPNRPRKEFSALKGVSFKANKGETLGIVGHNGSGKSTLLQLITGVLQPTSGSVKVNGRVAALLELGSGFNPEFTGRENVCFNASILGLNNEEIESRFQDIIEFADIGDFIERPVKTYSSGMMLRLAFAVVINIEPDILIVDEALSVGDDAFQRKCFSRIKQLQDNGVTILLVSHSAGSVVELCDRAILLDHGELLTEGNPKEVINCYHKLIHMEESKKLLYREQIKQGISDKNIDQAQDHEIPIDNSLYSSDLEPTTTVWYEQRGAKISNPRILNSSGNKVNLLQSGYEYSFCYDVDVKEIVFNLGFGMMIKTLSGYEVGGATSHLDEKGSVSFAEKEDCFTVTIKFNCNVRNGTYFMNCGCVGMIDGTLEFLHRGVDVLMFSVIEENKLSTGVVDFKPKFSHVKNKS
ncbi:ABC transporter ATP-binding protein [Vibrio cyclitrophicus]